MTGVGRSCDAVSFLTLGASIRGSRAYSESGGESAGRSTSNNSPARWLRKWEGTGELFHGVPRN